VPEAKPAHADASRPVVKCSVEKITCYADGLVLRLSLRNESTTTLRIDQYTLPFWFRELPLQDDAGNAWRTPRLRNHYHFAPPTERDSVLLGPHEARDVVLVDVLEEPKLRPAGAGLKARSPEKLCYAFRWRRSVYHKDLSDGLLSILFVGKGTVAVTWVNAGIPKGEQTRVLPKSRKGDRGSFQGRE
jgi:hypothetical protein